MIQAHTVGYSKSVALEASNALVDHCSGPTLAAELLEGLCWEVPPQNFPAHEASMTTLATD